MTAEEAITKMKSLLGITGTALDEKLTFAYEDATETALAYCNRDDIPSGMQNTVLRMAMELYKSGASTGASTASTGSSVVKAITIGDTKTEYATDSASVTASAQISSASILNDYKQVLRRYRKVGSR